MDECEAVPSSFIEKTVFNNRFNDYAKAHNIRPLSTTRFVALLKDQTEIPIADYRPHFDGKTAAPRCWLGVKFKEVVYKEDKKTDGSKAPSTPSGVEPTPSLRENENEGLEEKEKLREDRGKQNYGRGGRPDDPGFQKFKAGMKKRHCLKCGRDFNYDLIPYYNNGESGYICASCSMGQTEQPIKANPQTKLDGEASA
jgi:hypothetical protein